MKKIVPKLFLTLFLVSLFARCDTEENYLKENHHQVNNKIKLLKGQDARNIINQLNSKLQNAGLRPIYDENIQMRTIGQSIDFNSILQVIDTLGIKNYTFRILNHPSDDYKTFHNLVVTDKGTAIETTLMKYEMKEAFAQQYNAGLKLFQQFEGKVTAAGFSLSPLTPKPCEEVVKDIIPIPDYNVTDPTSGVGGSPTVDGGNINEYIGNNPGSGSSTVCLELMALPKCTNCNTSFDNWDSYFNAECSNGKYGLTFVLSYSVTNCRLASDPCNPDGDIGVLEPIKVEKNPCEQLNRIIPSSSIQQTLRILKSQSSGDDEYGNYISSTTNASGASYPSYPIVPRDPKNPHSLDIEAGLSTGNVKGVMHCHTNPENGGVPMFSPGDLDSLLDVALMHNSNGQEKNYAEYTITLSVGSGHYALKFKDFNDFISKYRANFNRFTKNLKDKYEISKSTALSDTLIKNFLNALKENNFGSIGLYKATEIVNNNGVSEISGWKEQTLDANGNLTQIPCN